ncbi:GH12783 [Drosophila grimshawi]|uniref:GH12783 n=2 Tax=Drosophila grimshawi TaxID=7222 RepID=B4JL39_DROGR|nr:GH12783 [Drosophila grimshawi]
MHVLDQIYFSPVLQRKFKALARLKRRRHDLDGKVTGTKRTTAGATGPRSPSDSLNAKLASSETRQYTQITTKLPASDCSNGSNGSQSSDVLTDASTTETNQSTKPKKQHATQTRKRQRPKKKHMPTENSKTRAFNRKTRINRNLRLWLANRRIFIFRSKKNRRQRVRSKPLKKRGEVVRTALDLPTTDPGSDLHFSTDDEELLPTGNVAFGAVAPLRHTLLQSELQRRYIEEIGDMVVQKPKQAHMPPELIVTTPSKSSAGGGVKKLEVYKLTPRTAPEQQGGLQLHSQSNATGARRTYSWHNLNQDSGHARPNFYINDAKPSVKIQKAPPRRSVPSNFIPLGQQRYANADDLHLKLSLKKKIWTGANGDNDGRPLAWYKGHQSQTHAHVASVMATAAAAAALRNAGGAQTRNMFAGSNKDPLATTAAGVGIGAGAGATTSTVSATLPPAYMGAPRRSRKLEQVDLFNACSQKLLMWQQEHKSKMQTSNARLMGGNSGKLDAQEPPQILMRGCKPKKNVKTVGGGGGNDVVHVNISSVSGKGKRKSSMIKIAETTQLVTRFSRTHASAGGGATLANANTNTTNANANANHQMTQMQRLIYKSSDHHQQHHHAGSVSATASGMQRTTSKFKTGGIVVTAVQQSTVNHAAPVGAAGVSRRIRHAHAHTHSHTHGHMGHTHTHNAGLIIKGSCNGAADNILQYRNANALQANKSTTGFSLDTVSLVRKVKTKLKKRKSRTLANAAAAKAK